MSRKTAVTALTGLVLLGGLALPAAADPLATEDDGDRTMLCLRLDPKDGKGGVCLWVPLPPPGDR